MPARHYGEVVRILFLLALIVAGIALVRALFRPRALRPPRWEPDPSDSPNAREPLGSRELLEPVYDGSEELVTLIHSSDPIAIEAYRGALHSAGIPVVVFDQNSSRMFGRISAVAMRIMVPTSRLKEAQDVIADLDPGASSAVD